MHDVKFYEQTLGFDQEMANKIGDYMEETGTNFLRDRVPLSVEKGMRR